MGWHPAVFWLSLVALTEFVGGLMLLFGFFTRFAAAAVIIFMINACWATSHRGGFFWSSGGMEYSLLIGVVALVFLIKGAGRFSIDHALGRGTVRRRANRRVAKTRMVGTRLGSP